MTLPSRSTTGHLYLADVVVESGEARQGHYLVVADDGYSAKVAALRVATEADVIGRHRHVYLTHLVKLPEGTASVGSEVLRRLALAVGADLNRYDSSRLPGMYVTPFGRAERDEVEAARDAGLCPGCGRSHGWPACG